MVGDCPPESGGQRDREEDPARGGSTNGITHALLPRVKRRNLTHNNLKTAEHRSNLRRNLTPAEAILWRNLQKSQLNGKKFRRQHAIGPYIVDFYCPEFRVAIELDGAGHMTALGSEKDREREEFLKRFNVRVIRFENRWVFENLEGVLNTIRAALEPPLE